MVELGFVRGFLAELCKDAKVKMISPHKARHNAATLAQAAMGDIHLVQIKELIGHSQVSLSADLYGHSSSIAQMQFAKVSMPFRDRNGADNRRRPGNNLIVMVSRDGTVREVTGE
jgi:integrase